MRRPDRAITFDCYGTLIDFDLNGAALDLLGDQLEADGVDVAAFLHDFRVMRWQGAMEGFQPYKSLLRRSLRNVMKLYRLDYLPEHGHALVDAVRRFPPFPEVAAVLDALRSDYRLAIISNTDEDLIRDNVRKIGVEFDHVITSERAGYYKPNAHIFEYALGIIGLPVRVVTHVAASHDYDVIPTTTLGMWTVWVNRGRSQESHPEIPEGQIRDLTGLPEVLLTRERVSPPPTMSGAGARR